MATKVITLLKDENKSRQFGQAGRLRVEKYFVTKEQINKILSYY